MTPDHWSLLLSGFAFGFVSAILFCMFTLQRSERRRMRNVWSAPVTKRPSERRRARFALTSFEVKDPEASEIGMVFAILDELHDRVARQ